MIIAEANDVGNTGHSALNIRGHTGSGGNTWATVVDCSPNDPLQNRLFNDQDLFLSTSFLIHRFDNAKGIGLLALAFDLEGETAPGNGKAGPDRALGLVVSNAGNTDKLQLMTVDTTGKVKLLQQVSLGAGIVEDKWYQMTLVIRSLVGICSISPSGAANCPVDVRGQVLRLLDPSDPNSRPVELVGTTLAFQGTLPFKDTRGEVGIMARAVNAYVDSSVTSFSGGRQPA